MTTSMFAAHLTPHTEERVALLALVVVFLIVEIPLVVSIFRKAAKDEGAKKAER